MTPYYVDDRATVYQGDALAVLPTLPDQSVDAVVTDPPYGLEFMGREWDSFGRTGIRGSAYQEWCQAWAAECLRLLRPGGHLLAFGGSRTFHRLVCAVEDAGFEIRDTISWLYGSGFPKSLDVSKAIDRAAGAEREVIGRYVMPADSDAGNAGKVIRSVDSDGGYGGHATAGREGTPITSPATDAARRWSGWGTALKPGWEPIVVARKPLAGTVAANVQVHGTGALNIDACRLPMGSEYDPGAIHRQHADTAGMNGLGQSGFAPDHQQPTYNEAGRWPPNVVLDKATAAGLDRQSGDRPSGGSPGGRAANTGMRGNTFSRQRPELVADAGGASRFFPTFRYEAKATPAERPRHDGAAHPTVKPLELMRWLVRLITPPAGLVLDPFVGSGTTAEACTVEGFRCIAVEREPTYLPLIRVRLAKPIQDVLPLGATP
jgi:site-specific DNA-methyltransferase (adenine-specific)